MIRFAKIAMLLMLMSIQSIGFVGSVMAQDTIKDLAAADKSSFALIPKATSGVVAKTYQDLSKGDTKNPWNRHQFWEAYNTKAKALPLKDQLATGVMNRDTIIAYASVVIEFISNLGLVVGAGFIIFSGYQYAMSTFGIDGMKEDNGKAIKNAFIGIAVIATSYGIFRLLARIFIE